MKGHDKDPIYMQKEFRPVHCLSFDIEEHFQVSAFESAMRRHNWDLFESRVERNTDKILDLIELKGLRATFFILGWVAERCPALVRRICAGGHEIASHGYAHELVTSQAPQKFREDIRKTKAILEDLTGQPVCGYRAPSFSITNKSSWALSILCEEGYGYDTSIVPIIHDRYGMPEAPSVVHQLKTESGIIWEIPPSTVSICGMRVPIGGGGYFRIFPYWMFKALFQKAEGTNSPLVTYFHPWEIDPDQPRMKGSRLSRFRHYTNLHRTQERLTRLLDDFAFAPIKEIIIPVREIYARMAKRNEPKGMVRGERQENDTLSNVGAIL